MIEKDELVVFAAGSLKDFSHIWEAYYMWNITYMGEVSYMWEVIHIWTVTDIRNITGLKTGYLMVLFEIIFKPFIY